MKELVLTAALVSLLICGVLCQNRSGSRYVPPSGDEDYEDPPQLSTTPPRRSQNRRIRPLPPRGQQNDEEAQRHPPPSFSRNTHSDQSLPGGYPAERAPPRPPPPQRSVSHARPRYGAEEPSSDHKTRHLQPDAHLEGPTAPPRPPRRRRPSKRLRNETPVEGDDGVQDKPRTRDHHQPPRSSPRVLDNDAPRPQSHRYQPEDDNFSSGDMQRLPRPTPKQEQENKRSREKPRILPRPPHSRYPPTKEDEDRQTQHLPVRRPILEPQPAPNRLPDENEESHRGLPDTYHVSNAPHAHAPSVHSAVQQEGPYIGQPGPPQSRPGINDNSYEVPEESLPHPPRKPNPEADIRQPQYPTDESSGTYPDFKEQTVGKERPHRNSRAQYQSESSPEGPSFPEKDNSIHRAADRGQNRNAPPQRPAQPNVNRRNPPPLQRESPDRNYDPTILKQNSDQVLRENTGRRVHAPSESEVRLPPNRQPLIAPDFAAKEDEPKVVSYRYQQNPQAHPSPYTSHNKDFEEPHNEDFPVPSDRLPNTENSDEQPDFPQNPELPVFTPDNFDASQHSVRTAGQLPSNVASIEAAAEAEIDRQITSPVRTHPQPANRLPVENAEEDSIAHIFPPPRLQHEPQSNVRSPHVPREVRAPQAVRDTRARQDVRDPRPTQNVRDQRSPPDTRDSRYQQRLREPELPHEVRDSRAPQNVRDSNRYREASSSRSRYNRDDLPEDDTRQSQRPQRVRPRYRPETPEEQSYNQGRSASQREEVTRSSGVSHHRSRPQYEEDPRRTSSRSRTPKDPEENFDPESQPRTRQRQSHPSNTQPRNIENRRPHYNAPPERDQPRATERRDHEQVQPKTNFKCPESFGFFGDSKQCDKYYECRNGTAVESVCMDGLAFNEISAPKYLRCDSLRDVDCSSRSELQEPRPTANCPRRFGLFAHETDCTKFWNCVDGASTEVKCPPGLVYSDARATCDWADLVENTCKSEDLLGFTCPEATSLELQDGVYSRYPHPDDCRLHFICIKGVDGLRRPRMLSCNDGTVFDKQSGQCTRAENAPGCENYYGTPVRSTKPQPAPASEEVEDEEPKVSRRRRPNKRTRGRAEERY